MSMMYYPDGVRDSVLRLVDISREFGLNPDYVLAGGGNTSVKEGGDLYVKASGTQLSTISADGFVQMSRSALDTILNKTYPEDTDKREAAVLQDLMAARVVEGDSRRPSVESLLHNLFPHKFVVHTHPALVNGITCSTKNVEAVRKVFTKSTVWLPVIDPGYTLALHVKAAVEEQTRDTGIFPQMVLLQNHGIFVAADSEAEIRNIYRSVFESIRQHITAEPDLNTRAITHSAALKLIERVERTVPGSHNRIFRNSDIDGFISDAESFTELKLSVTPDHIVYCGYRSLFVEDIADLETEISRFEKVEGFPPRIIAIAQVGVIASHTDPVKSDLAQKLFCDQVKIAVYARSFGGIQFMPEEHINFIRNWEAETYRASQSS